MPPDTSNDLKRDLLEGLKSDDAVFDFLRQTALDGLWFWDAGAPEDQWRNPRLLQILGHDPAAPADASSALRDAIMTDDLSKTQEALERHFEDPRHPYDQVLRCRHRDGHIVRVRCRGVAIRDATGQPRRMLALHEEISETAGAQQALAEREGDAILAGVLGTLGHEFNNKMTVILGVSDELEEGYPEESDIGRAASQILRASNDLMAVIGSWMAAASDRPPVPRTWTLEALEARIRDRLFGAAVTMPAAEIDLQSSWPPGWHVEVDAFHLVLAVSELVRNAAEADPDGVVQVRLALATQDGVPRASVEVQDTGTGIPETDLGKVFVPFFTTRPDARGKGLGLAYAQRVARQFGGDLSIANRKDAGVTATLVFPARPA